MKNRDFVVVLIVLAVLFFLAYKLIPILILSNLGNVNHAIRNDFCESDGDCVVLNMDYTSCSCDMRAVSVVYAEYVDGERAEYLESHDSCALDCEWEEAECVENKCVVGQDIYVLM